MTIETVSMASQPMQLLQSAVEQHRRQAEINRFTLEEMMGIHRSILNIQDDIQQEFNGIRIMVQEVRDSVTLNDTECYELFSLVAKKSVQFTKDYFGEEKVQGSVFTQQVGKFRRAIWKKLKQNFSVSRYSHIRRIDYNKAVSFIEQLTISSFIEL